MSEFSSYYLYERYEKRGDQDWIPCYPNTYSISGDSSITMPLMEKSSADTACGYVPTGDTLYQWINLDPSVDYYCSGTTKHYKQQRQVSYDNGQTWQNLQEYQQGAVYEYNSIDCGGGSPIYRWAASGTTCIGYDKWQNSIRQVSLDNGSTWNNVVPTEMSATTLIETYSTDCGYVPPTAETQYRWSVVGGMCDECEATKAMIHDGSGNTYVISGSGEITQAEVSGYASAATDVVITNNCTSIGNNAFNGFTGIQFARIPNTVHTIGDNAFINCSAMTECQVPYGTTSIGASAFTNCISLAYADIPNSVTSIGEYAFRNCLNFRYASIPSSITSIPSYCFINCDGLSDIELPSTITSIGENAFYNCSGLYSVTLLATTPPTLGSYAFTYTNSNLKIYVPCNSLDTYKAASGWSAYANRIRAIEASCHYKIHATFTSGRTDYFYCDNSTLSSGDTRSMFYPYSAITSAEIGDCVTSIGGDAFSGCTSLTSIDIPSSVTSIGNNCFYNCTSLTSINIPSGVTSIRNYTFQYCYSLTSCTIGSGVTSIGVNAFNYCRNLASLNIPSSVTSIGENAFRDCSGLTSCTIGSGVTSIGNNAFYGCSGLTSIDIPNSVTSIGLIAFYKCTSLSSCTIGSGVTNITIGYNGETILSGCTNLSQLTIKASSIGYRWFAQLKKPVSITLDSSVSEIGQASFARSKIKRLNSNTDGVVNLNVSSIGLAAFSECSGITNLIISNSISTIGGEAFSACRELTSITINRTTPPTLGNYPFADTNDCPIYVPSGSVDAYKAANGWIGYASRIQAIPNS